MGGGEGGLVLVVRGGPVMGEGKEREIGWERESGKEDEGGAKEKTRN